MNGDLSHNQKLPRYNIKAVSNLVGLLPVTIRAWERRYGLPNPSRNEQGYRLYSEQDLRLLRWLKSQNDAGLSIGQVVKHYQDLLKSGVDPTQAQDQSKTEAPTSSVVSLENLANQFYEKLQVYDDLNAKIVLERAFAIYKVDQVLVEVIEKVLVRIGEDWHAGKIPIAVEHFATQFCLQNLLSLSASSVQPSREGVILAGCAPGESHQIGLLNLVVLLRWRGWDVKYFGPDLNLERLKETLIVLRPDLVMFSATRTENARRLQALDQVLKDYPFDKPQVVVGGMAYLDAEIEANAPGIVIREHPSKAVEQIEKIIYKQQAR